MSEDSVHIDDAILIPIDQIFPNEWNPNSQSDNIFAHLVAEIQEDGFQTPLVVVPWPEHEGSTDEVPHYKIIEGEHRWKAANLLEMTELPCFVNTVWDEQAQKIKTVRRNQLSGQLDDQKFTQLITSLADEGLSQEEIARLMAFEDTSDLMAHVLEDMKKDVDKSEWLQETSKEEVSREVEAIDGISDILNHIFSNYGETVPNNFVFFSYKGKTHLMVMSTKELFDEIENMVNDVREANTNMADHLLEIFGVYKAVKESGLVIDE